MNESIPMTPMRRKDREITDPAAIGEILDRCDACRVALNGPDGYPYLVPLCFGWEEEGGKYRLYFHCASQGTKLGLLRADGRCAFELDAGHRLIWDEEPCRVGMDYESVCGLGRLEEVTEPAEKARGLQKILYQYTGEENASLPETALDNVTVLRLEVLSLRAKRRGPSA